MIYNISSDIETRQPVWTIRDLTTGLCISGVPAYKLREAEKVLLSHRK